MLSKSQYVRGLQCHKALWLYKHRKELIKAPTAQQAALFETGDNVGDLACKLFPGGKLVEFDPSDFQGMIDQTRQWIKDGETIIYEAAFKQAGVFAMADILVKNGDRWDIYEVKASTKVKTYHLDDASVQWYALSQVLDLGRAFIVHVNSSYVRQGELEIDRLFSITEITDHVLDKQPQVPELIAEMETMLQSDEPVIDIGPHCSSPHSCDFKHHCWQTIPKPSVFDLYRMNANTKFQLYHQGIVALDQIPAKQKLTPVQRLQVRCAMAPEIVVQPKKIASFLKALQFPLHFFDFETFQEAIPRFDHQSPYQQMAFQYSLHILHEDGRLEHKEFLGDEQTDPRYELVKQMEQDILPTGTLVAFNQSFEKRIIRELAKRFPEHKAALLDIHGRFEDLIKPFRNQSYYHPDFNGSFSIKSVLPAMFPNDPELDYKQLNIQNGGMAMNTFAKLHRLKDPSQRKQIRRDLLAYCRLDTLAMVKIYQKLDELASHGEQRNIE